MAGFLTLDHRHPTPLHAQLEHGIRAAIATGRLRPATSCPPCGSSPLNSSVNANTVARVYVHLERAGVLETRRGVGTFVASRQATAAPERWAPGSGTRRDSSGAVVNEAAARGFSIDDVVRQIKELAGQDREADCGDFTELGS